MVSVIKWTTNGIDYNTTRVSESIIEDIVTASTWEQKVEIVRNVVGVTPNHWYLG